MRQPARIFKPKNPASRWVCAAGGEVVPLSHKPWDVAPGVAGMSSVEPETVGGPVDVAVISRHEGFVWVKRKYYFNPAVNPRYMARAYKLSPELQSKEGREDEEGA